MHANGSTNQSGTHAGIVGTHYGMCCAKVVSESKFVIRPPIECDGLPRNGLGCATMLDIPSLYGTGMGGVASIGC